MDSKILAWINASFIGSMLHLFDNKSTVSNCKREGDKFLFQVKQPIATGLSEIVFDLKILCGFSKISPNPSPAMTPLPTI